MALLIYLVMLAYITKGYVLQTDKFDMTPAEPDYIKLNVSYTRSVPVESVTVIQYIFQIIRLP